MQANSDNAERRRNIRRTTIMVSAIALAFYVGFILIGVIRA